MEEIAGIKHEEVAGIELWKFLIWIENRKEDGEKASKDIAKQRQNIGPKPELTIKGFRREREIQEAKIVLAMIKEYKNNGGNHK
ncbi:hypothetical protein AMJ49_07240 [Parcubacteria bacterium DG_74_2]|nr:MAG: hypothetical protein AMJ49_07240 [Parcubacteria bacterium DG_74_2]